MELKDYYSVRGVIVDASAEDTRKAFRRLALQHHPDHNPENIKEAEAKFKGIDEAYEILGNEEIRWRYDSLTTLSGYSSRTVLAGNSKGIMESDITLEMLRRFAGLGFVVRGAGLGRWGCGCRGGRYRRQWRQDIG